MCRRRFIPLLVALAGLGLAAGPALSAPPKQRIETQNPTIPPGAQETIFEFCPKGFTAVAGYVIQFPPPGPVQVGESRRGNEKRTWVFRVWNPTNSPQQIRLVVRCLKFRLGIGFRLRQRRRTVPGGEADVFRVPCPRAYGPAGAGFRHTPAVPPGAPQPPGSLVRTTELKPVRGGFEVEVENHGPDAASVEHQAICVERRDPGVRVTSIRSTSRLELQPGERRQHSQRCPRGSAAASAGWSTRRQSFMSFSNDFHTVRFIEFIMSNDSPSQEEVQTHALCLSQTRAR